MTQQNILNIVGIVGILCFLISSLVYPFVRFLIIKKHLPRLNKLNRSGCKRIESDMALWWSIYGDIIIMKIDKKLGRKLFIMTLIFCYLLFIVGVVCILISIIFRMV